MDIKELTEAVRQARDLLAAFEAPASVPVQTTEASHQRYPIAIGQAYFFRGVTYHWTGRVKAVVGSFAVLEEAAWIASSGRFSATIAEGTTGEVEAMPDRAFVNMDTCVDIIPWDHALPRETK